MNKPCCDMMKMVLGRARPHDQLGLMVETLFRVRDGKPREAVALRFRSAPRGDKGRLAAVTLAEINYCPFCGKRIAKPSEYIVDDRASL